MYLGGGRMCPYDVSPSGKTSAYSQNLQMENQMLKAQIAQLQKMVYGFRTERTKRILPETADEQMDLFNEAESRRRKMCPNRASRCPHVYRRCGTALTFMGKEKLLTEIEFIPAKIKVISIEKPDMPQPVIAKSIVSPSSVAHVMVQKYQQSMPLYRQKREWKEIGIPLSRATLTN